MSTNTEDEEQFDQDYSSLVGSSVALSASLQGNRIIHIHRKVRDIPSNSLKTFSCPYILNDEAIKPLLAPVEVSKRVIDCNSSSGLVNVKINDQQSCGGEKKCLIEITRDVSLEKVVDVSEVHGKVIGDAWFGRSGCHHFSNDEKYFVYVAVPKESKKTSYFDTASASPKTDTTDSMFPSKYDYKEDWGEKYTGVSELGLYVLNIDNGKVIRIPNVSPDITVGQPVFTPCGRGVVYTAWSNHPKRLGMIYCFQRPCSLMLVPILNLLDELDIISPEIDNSVQKNASPSPEASHVLLTPQLRQARYPQFSSGDESIGSESKGESYLVFLGHEKGFDTHNASCGLYSLNWTEVLLASGPDLWEQQKSSSSFDINSEKYLKAVIEPGAAAMAKSTNVLVNGFHFPGLFSTSISPCSFITTKHLLLETNWRAVTVVLVVDIETNEIRTISMQNGHLHLSAGFYSAYTVNKHVAHLGERTSGGVEYAIPVNSNVSESSWQSATPFSLNLLCTGGGTEGGIVFVTSNTSSRPRLAFVATAELLPLLAPSKMSGLILMIPFTANGKKLESIFSSVMPVMAVGATGPTLPDSVAITEEALAGMESFLMQARASDNRSVLIESMLLLPSHDFPGEGLPLLVVPHGGPHSQFTTCYMAPYTYMALTLNMAVLMVNYRGSTGYGQLELDSLPGKIGTQDVCDMHTATLGALEVNDVRLDPQRICVAGGSHGGFLTAHLLGQYPTLFRAGACRNPVTNIPSMAMVSDITDWCIVEACGLAGGENEKSDEKCLYNFNSYETPNSTQIGHMYDSSPIRHVEKVRVPVLMLLGVKDRRVPVSQGLEYYHALRRVPDRIASDVPTEMRLYPDADHAIDIPDSEADQFISMKKWFAKYV